MIYPYMTLSDNTEITHIHLFEEMAKKTVEVHIEHPTDNGFESARYSLPSYKWILREGFTDDEIAFLMNFYAITHT